MENRRNILQVDFEPILCCFDLSWAKSWLLWGLAEYRFVYFFVAYQKIPPNPEQCTFVAKHCFSHHLVRVLEIWKAILRQDHWKLSSRLTSWKLSMRQKYAKLNMRQTIEN